MARLAFSRLPDGELGIEYNAANMRAQAVYSTSPTPQMCVVTITGGAVLRQEIADGQTVPIPGNRRMLQTAEGLEVDGVLTYQFGAL